MRLHDYDVVRKHFDCWKPSGLHPATVAFCLQVRALFLFVSWLLFSHSRCICSLKHQECLEHSYYFKSPTIAHSERTGCKSKGDFLFTYALRSLVWKLTLSPSVLGFQVSNHNVWWLPGNINDSDLIRTWRNTTLSSWIQGGVCSVEKTFRFVLFIVWHGKNGA